MDAGCPPTVDSSTSAGTSALTAVCADGTDIDSLTTAGLYYYNDAGNINADIPLTLTNTGIVHVLSLDNGNVIQIVISGYNNSTEYRCILYREFDSEEWSAWATVL